MGERLKLSIAEEEIRSDKNWGARRSNMTLRKLERPDYIDRPYTDRAEYIELLMAIAHAPKYADAMSRRNKDSTAMDILYRAMDTENVEYLLKGSRHLCVALWSGNAGGLVGTCGNEAPILTPLTIAGDYF